MRTGSGDSNRSETGWLIEAEDHSRGYAWLRLVQWPGSTTKVDILWTADSSNALRFARREDAVAFAWLHPQHCTLALVTEHQWC